MKKLLISGFEPFGGDDVNPSWEAVRILPDVIGEYELVKVCLPVVFGEAARKLITLYSQTDADVILCVGLAGSRTKITPEKIGINWQSARIPDNAGNSPEGRIIRQPAPDGLFATVPVERMVQALQKADIPAEISYSAGTYVCNDTLFRLLWHCQGTETRVGFVHVPLNLPYAQLKEGLMMMIDAL